MKIQTRTFIISAVFMLAGCQQESGLGTKVEALEKQLKSLKQDTEIQQILNNIESTAYLTPGSTKYSVVKYDLGSLTVAITDVRPYANGSKVTLQFGNLASAHILGLKAIIEWGSVDKQGSPNNEHAKSKEITLSEQLNAGMWTNAEIILEGTPPTDLGFIRIKGVTHRGVKLRNL